MYFWECMPNLLHQSVCWAFMQLLLKKKTNYAMICHHFIMRFYGTVSAWPLQPHDHQNGANVNIILTSHLRPPAPGFFSISLIVKLKFKIPAFYQRLPISALGRFSNYSQNVYLKELVSFYLSLFFMHRLYCILLRLRKLDFYYKGFSPRKAGPLIPHYNF